MSKLKYEVNIEETTSDTGIRYRVAKEKDLGKCMDMWFDVFLKDEPAMVSLGGQGSTRSPGIISTMTGIFREGVTVIAEDTKNGDKPVGIRVAYVLNRDETKKEADAKGRANVDELGDLPYAWRCMEALSERICYGQDIFERYPDVEKIYYFFGLATDPTYRGKGIAGKLVDVSLKVARSVGCTGCLVFATNDLSRRIFDKMGMEVVSETDWSSVDIGGGKNPFEGREVKSKCVSTLFMRI